MQIFLYRVREVTGHFCTSVLLSITIIKTPKVGISFGRTVPPVEFHRLKEAVTRSTEAVLKAHPTSLSGLFFPFNLSPICMYYKIKYTIIG